jgi:cyclohexyl-isocyanide hydratase
VGATHGRSRIVEDGNVITAAGVASGIDFALHVASLVAGPDVAQTIQLGIEYDPAPPFTTGHPDHAPAAIVERARQRNERSREAFRAVLLKQT